eukprot:GHVS01055868.1.p1 GENE.GHVS01055868.1~~GHVS01055868.1.p1  ORF type:complete len:859 (+),score=145.05 GHVS01055868.1:321-2897(+)
MVYLLIKSLEVNETEVFIVTSSLTKDMNCANDCYRANAIRVLSKIVDPSMAAQIERYLKTAIVDKNPFVASSALLCGIQLLRTAPEVVRRWVNEVSESVSSKHPMVQFHALGLLYELKRNDRLALQKVVSGLTKNFLKSPLAECLLIRYAGRLAGKDPSLAKPLMDYLEGCLRHKSEMVYFEAAKALCELAITDVDGQGGTSVFGYDLIPAITALQIMLTSPKPVMRFAAVRVLNRLAQVRAHAVSRCNVDMEPMLTDTNRSIATLALTTLLKTGHESNVDRLIKQIASFMNEITDSFKMDIVQAVKQLCITYPSKHKVLMGFLSSNLREEGSIEFKSDTVDALMLLVRQVPQAQEIGLLQLCEFIEDCEYPSLCTRILGFLGEQAPTTTCPSKYIRFIYNRLILENALVRVAGVDALTTIAQKCPGLRRDVMALLECCATDNDDEVRDRTNLYYASLALSVGDQPSATVDLLDMKDDDGSTAATTTDLPGIDELVDVQLPVALDALCDELSRIVTAGTEGDLMPCDEELVDISRLPTPAAYAALKEQEKVEATAAAASAAAAQAGAAGAAARKSEAALPGEIAKVGSFVETEIKERVKDIVGGNELGKHECSTRAVDLTEREAEYTVQVVKHLFKGGDILVCEFNITNTLQDQVLSNVDVQLGGFDTSIWSVIGSVPISSLVFDVAGSAYVVMSRQPAEGRRQVGATVFSAVVKFLIREEGDDVGFEDAYPVEGFTVGLGDYMVGRLLRPGEFKAQWDSLETQGAEVVSKFCLSFKSVESAVEGLIASLNLAACEKTDTVEPHKPNHTMMLSGSFVGGWHVLCRLMVVMSPEYGCLLKIACRSKNEAVCQAICQSFE